MKLTIKIKRYAPPEMKLRDLNRIVREGLTQAAIWWIENCLPKHFEPGAVQRYQYMARQEAYNAIKRKMLKVRPWIGNGVRGSWEPAPKPPGPLCWAGTLKETTLGRSAASFNIRSVSTSKKKQVTIPVPLPHPMSKDQCDELTKLIQSEIDMMVKIAWEMIQQLFSVYGNQSIEEIIG